MIQGIKRGVDQRLPVRARLLLERAHRRRKCALWIDVFVKPDFRELRLCRRLYQFM